MKGFGVGGEGLCLGLFDEFGSSVACEMCYNNCEYNFSPHTLVIFAHYLNAAIKRNQSLVCPASVLIL